MAAQNVQAVESIIVMKDDTKDATDGDAKRKLEDITGKCWVIPISFYLYTHFFLGFLFTVVADSAPFNPCVYSAAQGRKKRSKQSKDESSKDAVSKEKKEGKRDNSNRLICRWN